MCYSLDMFYIPSCMSGSRNFKMAKLEDTRNVGMPVAHMGMKKMSIFVNCYSTSVYPSWSIQNIFSDEKWVIYPSQVASQLCASYITGQVEEHDKYL